MENGGTSTFAVVLNTQPTASVSIDISSTDSGVGYVSPLMLEFDNAYASAMESYKAKDLNTAVALFRESLALKKCFVPIRHRQGLSCLLERVRALPDGAVVAVLNRQITH